MSDFLIPPTFAPPFIKKPGSMDPTETAINPIWLAWFLAVGQTFTASGGLITDHNSLFNLQGGNPGDRFHLDATEHAILALFVANGAVAGHVIEDEGVPLAQRDILNFVGAGVTVTDSGSETIVTILGGGGGGGAAETLAKVSLRV
jgi:hypothetical protein